MEAEATTRWVDTHLHLNQFSRADARRLVDEARDRGVRGFLTAGVDLPTSRQDVAAAGELGPDVWVLVGVHPWWADSYDEPVGRALADLARREPRVVGFGEIGLDFVRGRHPEPTQVRAFEDLLDLAAELRYPVLIHSDRIDDRTHREVQDAVRRRSGRVAGAVHGFAGSREAARGWLDLGFALSFSGVVTWPERDDLREIARTVPVERLLLETDTPAPYAPAGVPPEANHPRHLRDVGGAVARLRGMDETELAAAVWENLTRLFPRLRT